MADTRVIRKQNKLWVEKMDRVCVCVCVCVCVERQCVYSTVNTYEQVFEA
jgi:hypothetical protein